MPTEFFIRQLMLRKHRHLQFDGVGEFGSGLNVLIGRNGSGKTTILQLIRELSQGPTKPSLGDFVTAEPNEVVNRIVIDRAEGGASVEAIANTNEWSGWQALEGRIRFVTSDRQLANQANIRSFLANVQEYQMSEPTENLNISDEFNKAIMAELFERLKGEGAGLVSVTSQIESDYRSALVDFGKDIRVDVDHDPMVYFVDANESTVPIDALSAGEKEYLYFYSLLRRLKTYSNNVLLVDEPELHLHSSQVAQICDMLREISHRNQVIVATHSSDVLRHFIGDARIVLLAEARMSSVELPEQMRVVVDELGMPIDPSVFTAEWVVAENRSGKALAGQNAPTTEEALAWILGVRIDRRYWAFGSSRASVSGADEVLAQGAADSGDLSFSIIFDGDKQCVSAETYPPTAEPHADGDRIYHLPCWEIENLFLSDELMGLLDAGLGALQVASDQTAETELEAPSFTEHLWRVAEDGVDVLVRSVQKTVAKNAVKRLRVDALLGGDDPEANLDTFKSAVDAVEIDFSQLRSVVEEQVANRNWRWLPGKELLSRFVGERPDYWDAVRALDPVARSEALRVGIASSPIEPLAISAE